MQTKLSLIIMAKKRPMVAIRARKCKGLKKGAFRRCMKTGKRRK